MHAADFRSYELLRDEHVSLCETLDRVLNKGVVVAGELVICVADVDLLYLSLQLMLTSVETATRLACVVTPTEVTEVGRST